MAAEAIVAKSKAFADVLLIEFSAENMRLGAVSDGKTNDILEKLDKVIRALSAGALEVAIQELKAIPQESYDDRYITHARVLSLINKIEQYLNIPRTDSA